MTDNHVEPWCLLSNPFLTPGKRNTRTQHTDLKSRLLEKRFESSLNVVLVGVLDEYPDFSSSGSLRLDEIDQGLLLRTDHFSWQTGWNRDGDERTRTTLVTIRPVTHRIPVIGIIWVGQ